MMRNITVGVQEMAGDKHQTGFQNRLQETIERARNRCDFMEIYYVSRGNTPIEFENNRLKSINTSDNEGMAIRVVVDGKLGFSTTTRLDSIDEAVEYALASAAYGGAAELNPVDGSIEKTEVKVYDENVPGLAMETMLEMGESLLDPIRSHDASIQAFAGVEKEEGRVLLINSNGYLGEYRATGFGFYAGGELVEGDNMLWAYDSVGRCNLGDVEGEILDLARNVVNQFALGRKNVPFTSGRYTVVFAPRALADLLRPIVACLDGKAVDKGLSPWRYRLGEQILSASVNLMDDATIPFGPGSYPFDGEGTPGQQTPLVVSGSPQNFYLDRRTALRLGRKPTGNGQRSLTSPPGPSPSNLILQGGYRSIRDIQAEIKEGVLVENLMGAWAGNPYSGEVTGNISLGYLIKDGQPAGRIKNCLVAANAFEAFSTQLAALSSEQNWVGSQLLPYGVFEGISVNTQA